MFYVDGENVPRIEGTGTEDYFNDAWGLRLTEGPWTGTPIAEGEGVGARLSGYRWHVPDPVPFTKSLRVQIEHAGWTYNADGTVRSGFEERPDFFSSVAFWYQEGVNEDLPEPPYGNQRLPHGNALQIEVENSLPDVTAEKGEASVQKEVFWSKDILFFKAQGPGARINIPIDVPKDGRYELIAQVAQAPDYGDYVATVDGKLANARTLTWASYDVPPPDAEVIRNYSYEMYVAPDHMLGWFELTKGRHTLTFTCTGKDPLSTGYNLGVDGVVLAEVGKFGPLGPSAETAQAPMPGHPPAGAILYRGRPLSYYEKRWEEARPEERAGLLRQIGSFGPDASPAIKLLTDSLTSDNPEVRAAACWAFSQMGGNAAPAAQALGKLLQNEDATTRLAAALALRDLGPPAAVVLPALIAALSDVTPTTRFVAAAALAHMGSVAVPAIPALVERLQVPNEEVRILRNVAQALGMIGPPAASAIPSLQNVRKQIGVREEADQAILRIQGKPVRTWH
jgi:hypothetical protein